MLNRGNCGGTPGSLAAVALVTVLLGGCATAQGESSASFVPPKNYRQLVAAKLRQMEDPSVIQYVGITQPTMMFVGIFNGGTRPAVCVQVERPNIFGARAAWYYSFYFENGQVDGFKRMTTGGYLQQAMMQCEPPLTPITDLVRSRR
jgi:hypothetical protein